MWSNEVQKNNGLKKFLNDQLFKLAFMTATARVLSASRVNEWD